MWDSVYVILDDMFLFVFQARYSPTSHVEETMVPPSTCCLLKNFRKKSVELGNVRITLTTTEDLYSVTVDAIFDHATNLYEGEGSIGDIFVGNN